VIITLEAGWPSVFTCDDVVGEMVWDGARVVMRCVVTWVGLFYVDMGLMLCGVRIGSMDKTQSDYLVIYLEL
jgi:hypothetical protein